MLYKCLIVFLLLLYTAINHAQEVYVLHKQVGDTITKNEAYTYHIFEDLKVYDYSSAIINKLENQYRVDFFNENIIQPIFINQEKIDLYYNNIEKITIYLTQKPHSSDSSYTNIFSEKHVQYKSATVTPVVLFSDQELKNIGLSGAVLTEEGRERLEREEKEKERMKNHFIRISNEFIEYGSEDASIQLDEPILRKNKVIKKARESIGQDDN